MKSRMALVFALCTLPLGGVAQQVRVTAGGISSEYRLVSVPSELKDQRLVLQIKDHTVQPGETVESILMSRQIAPTPRAMGLVLDANPDIKDVNDIRAGFQMAVPELAGAPELDTRVFLGAPVGVYRLNRVKDQLLLRAQQTEEAGSQQAFRALASSMEVAARADTGLSASSIDALQRAGQSLLSLNALGDLEEVRRTAALAQEMSVAVDEASSNARMGKTNKKMIQISGTEPPGGAIPVGCRLRYAYEGYTWKGHVVRPEHTSDFETSNCRRGMQVLDVGAFYGVWAEWKDGPHTRRSNIKTLKIRADFDPQVDLPLYPFE